MAHIAGMLAEEIGANVSVAKAGALLYDLQKDSKERSWCYWILWRQSGP